MSIESDCSSAADMMSCAAMMGLAKQEAAGNLEQLSYLVNNPACERYHSFADRSLEHNLQMDATLSMSRKLCVTKTPLYGQGPWINMMKPPLQRAPVNFDEWTSRKHSSI
jgi:hypothetical protein